MVVAAPIPRARVPIASAAYSRRRRSVRSANLISRTAACTEVLRSEAAVRQRNGLGGFVGRTVARLVGAPILQDAEDADRAPDGRAARQRHAAQPEGPTRIGWVPAGRRFRR